MVRTRPPVVLAWLGAAAWAGAFPLLSDLPNQVAWGWCAAPGYLLAALSAAVLPRPAGSRAAACAAVAGAVLLPLAALVLTGRHQSEVTVVERSAWLLLHTGSPYLPRPVHVVDYDPYLPGMAPLGLPRALLGDAGPLARVLGDARLWFGAVFLGCLWHGRRRPLPLAVLTASPLVAPALAAGGVDLPLIGACCLAMASAERGHPARTGLALAFACTLKWTAWPALPVALLLLRRRHGSAPARRAGLLALTVAGAATAPFALGRTRELYEQVVLFPLGLAAVRTPAGSPLPGRLLAGLGPPGSALALALLGAAALAVTARLLTRPPATAVAACDLLAAGLALAFLLAPAGRFGYLALPAVLVVWPRLAAAPGRPVPEPRKRPTHRQPPTVPIVSRDTARTRE